LKYLGFIVARAGSKGIPGKNLKKLCGKPLIQYTIEEALKSKFLDHVFLSTDGEDILSFGKKFKGLDCDYSRPSELATDEASTVDTLIHGIGWLQAQKGLSFENIVLLQPTSPLRRVIDIDEAICHYEKGNKNSLVSVNLVSENPMECVQTEKRGGWSYVAEPTANASRRQDYDKKFYFINGAIYIRNTKEFLKEKNLIIKNKSDLYEMPRERGVDIDTDLDFAVAEHYMKLLSL